MTTASGTEHLAAITCAGAAAFTAALMARVVLHSILERLAVAPSARIRVRVRRIPSGSRRASLLGLGLILALPAGAKASRPPVRDAAPVEQPWRPVDGAPPPLPSTGAEELPRDDARSGSPPWKERAHRAVHGRGDAPVVSLFPREPHRPEGGDKAGAGQGDGDVSGTNQHVDDTHDVFLPPGPLPPHAEGASGNRSAEMCDLEKAACMRRHPAGKGMDLRHQDGRPVTKKLHRVRPGESLWSIAAHVLQTNDLARIARYWPRIHRANRETIERPDVIYAGQILRLPPEKNR